MAGGGSTTGGTSGQPTGTGGTGTQSYAGYCSYPVAAGTNNNTVPGGGGGGNVNQGCPDVSGTWSMDQHCDPGMVGDAFEVTQSGCNLSVPSQGWTGSVTAVGGISMGGPAGGSVLTCTGTASQTQLTVECQPGACHVEMSK